MDIIKKTCEFVSDKKQIEYLEILKKCTQNSIDKKTVVSKSGFKKKYRDRPLAAVMEDHLTLAKINTSIDYYNGIRQN